MKRVTGHAHAGNYNGTPFDHIVLAHDERHLRRKVLTLQKGEQILIDLPDPIAFTHGDVLILEDGRMAEVIAAEEVLYEVTPRDRQHLSELAWHLGNRHLPAQLEEKRIVILRDHVIKAMLEGLGATVTEIVAPFHPMRGAYHSGHDHDHHGHEHEHHDHSHGHHHHSHD
ncbi:urease accessory protein UreE [Phyllobacterium myrsinacearum]|uniref:Urease accessory protein UreE n=1 Tax=Phyllobacterium myrsinacearum TaxID=28101 RepID=A0A839EK93_9HYPH|nr:urease accessory protein UreE [Phyllobacterium myrsinacearum]MBA8877140.1 urease accessory protein [Phyllobacterium myrsinacearum]